MISRNYNICYSWIWKFQKYFKRKSSFSSCSNLAIYSAPSLPAATFPTNQGGLFLFHIHLNTLTSMCKGWANPRDSSWERIFFLFCFTCWDVWFLIILEWCWIVKILSMFESLNTSEEVIVVIISSNWRWLSISCLKILKSFVKTFYSY